MFATSVQAFSRRRRSRTTGITTTTGCDSRSFASTRSLTKYEMKDRGASIGLRSFSFWTFVCLILAGAPDASAGPPQINVLESDFDFGRVLIGTPVEHQFVLKNESRSPAVI